MQTILTDILGVVAQFMLASPKGIIECMRTIARGDFRAELPAVAVPTLIVHGDKDMVNPPDRSATRLTRRMRSMS